MSYKQKGTT